jgi:hypothetical protein
MAREAFMKTVPVWFIALVLIACGADNQHSSNSDQAATQPEQATTDSTLDDAALDYQEKVRRKTSDSVVKSLAKEWGVSEDKVRCLSEDLSITQYEYANSDPAVGAVFEKCGIDPAVVE